MEEKFDYIDHFRNGLARARKGNKWGVIDDRYNVVVPIAYDSIWRFWDKTFNNIVLEKDGERFKVSFDNPSYVMPYYSQKSYEENNNQWEDEPGWGSYDEYGGPNGYDDFTIDAAFDGDPDAVWNID